MAFGRHWEWRAFGRDEEALRQPFRSLLPLFPDSQRLTDRYLWVAGARVNVKLRLGDLKVKRRLQVRSDGLEEWVEDPSENYSFPLEARVVERVAADLGIVLREPVASGAGSEDALLSTLAREAGELRVIAIEKRRWQYGLPDVDGVIVELAEIGAPERCLSVCVEANDEAEARRALARLRLPAPLRPASYLEALETWGRGGRMFQPEP